MLCATTSPLFWYLRYYYSIVSVGWYIIIQGEQLSDITYNSSGKGTYRYANSKVA